MKALKRNGLAGGMAALLAVAVLGLFSLSGCASAEVAQYGLEADDTIALNLTKDPNVGSLYVTHVNGEATGAYVKHGVASILTGIPDTKYVNPLYVKLTDNPIVFTILCPVVYAYDSQDRPQTLYQSTEIRLTKLSDLKAGDVLTLKWMYQTETFAFIDATGNIVQQVIPTFN